MENRFTQLTPDATDTFYNLTTATEKDLFMFILENTTGLHQKYFYTRKCDIYRILNTGRRNTFRALDKLYTDNIITIEKENNLFKITINDKYFCGELNTNFPPRILGRKSPAENPQCV